MVVKQYSRAEVTTHIAEALDQPVGHFAIEEVVIAQGGHGAPAVTPHRRRIE